MTSRTVSYEFTAKQSLTTAFTQTQAAVNATGAAMGGLSQKISSTVSDQDRLKVSVRETGNEYTRLRDQANAYAAQQRAIAATARAQASSGGGLGLGGIIGGAALGTLAIQGAQAAAGALVDTGKSALTLAGNLETAQGAFTTLLGSGQAATAMLGDLQAFANRSPFRATELQAYATSLLGVGENARNVLPDLKDIGSEIAGRGLNEQQMTQVVRAYDQILSKGKLAGDEAMQLQESLIPVWQILGEHLHMTAAQVQELSAQGQISARIFQEAFHADAVNNFGGAIERQSHTWNGLRSTAQDLGETLEKAFGTGVIAELKPRLEGALAALQNPAVLETITAWGVAAGKVAGQLWDAGKAVASWIGLELPEVPPAPDYGPLAADTGKIGPNLSLSVGAAQDFKREIASTKSAIDKLRDAQATANAQDTNRINSIRDATTAQDRLYQAQTDKLRDAGTQMERNYQTAKKAHDLEQARAQVGQDERLAGDIFSSVGQAARERLQADRERVRDLQGEMSQDAAKAANQDALTRVERNKQGYDQQQQDAVTAIERERTAREQANAQAMRDLEATADAYAKLQQAIATPDPGIKAASDAYRQYYDSAFQGVKDDGSAATRDAVAEMTAQYAQFYGSTLPKAAATGRPSIITALFGTQADQESWGTALTTNVLTGVGTAVDDWGKGHGSPILNVLMGGKDWQEAFDNWAGQAGAVEQAGADVAKGVRQVAGLDLPGAGGTGKGPESNASRAAQAQATGQPFTANPLDPDSWNPFSPNNPLVKLVTGLFGGGRAGGGPVMPGGTYMVGERGPELLRMGARGGGYVTPAGGSSGGTVINLTVQTLATNEHMLAQELFRILGMASIGRGLD